MWIRAAIFFCCIGGLVNAQETPVQPQTPPPANPAASSEQGSTPARQEPNARVHSKQKGGQANQQKPVHGSAAKPAPNKTTAADAPALHASPAQKILDALDASIRQPVNGAPRPDLSALLAKESELQNRLTANGEPAQISREGTEVLVSLYAQNAPAPQASPPALDDKARSSGEGHADLMPVLIIAIVVALMSPLICVAGFWWAGKASENTLRRVLREAGLL